MKHYFWNMGRTVKAIYVSLLLLVSCSDLPPNIEYSKGELWVARFRNGNFPSKALHNQKIYCSSLQIGNGKPNFFYCLDLPSGRVAWRSQVGSWASSLPLVTDSLIYYSSYLGHLYRFDTAGNPVWQAKLSCCFAGHMLNPVNGNLMVLTVDDGCIEYDRQDGRVVHHWGKRTLGMAMPVIEGHRIYLSAVNRDTTVLSDGDLVVCLDYFTKDTIWKAASDRYNVKHFLHEGRLYFFSNKRLHCLDADSGKPAWSSLPHFAATPNWPEMYFEQGRVYADP